MSSKAQSAVQKRRHQLASELEVIRIQTIMRQVAVLPIRAYQIVLSPLLPPACRFEPRCSEYSAEAIILHGVSRGGWLALRRILRCHPWSEAGIDRVPPAFG